MNHNKLLIIGVGGHGRVVADIARQLNKYNTIAFLDDTVPPATFAYPFLGTTSKFELFLKEYDIVVGIGNSKVRQIFIEKLVANDASIPMLIHPKTCISEDVAIGKGTVVMPGSIINTGTTIGTGVIVNTASSIDHDCCIGDYCHVAVGVHLCGTVTIGKHTWIGAGTTISNNISICSNCIIGAGATVLKNVFEPCTLVGCPAHSIHRNV